MAPDRLLRLAALEAEAIDQLRSDGNVQPRLINEAAALGFDLEGQLSQISLVDQMDDGEPNDAMTHRHSSVVSRQNSDHVASGVGGPIDPSDLSHGSMADNSENGLVAGQVDIEVIQPRVQGPSGQPEQQAIQN